MSLRFLLGILTSGLSDENNKSTQFLEEINVSKNAGGEDFTNIITDFQTPAKFHIGMLTISLIVGIAYSGYTTYICWMEKNIFLGYIRNLVIALACRTFFSILFDGVILLGSPLNIGGGNCLLSFEQIFLNLVIAFWLTLNIYLHERVQRNFNNEPTLVIYQFGVPGVGLFFAFIWIFTLQDQRPSIVWWVFLNPFTQWIVNSINLLYLLTQLGLLANIVRTLMKITPDNDSISLIRKTSVMMGVLVLIFWLQFGLSIGRIPLRTPESHLYFYYLIDGLECALICLILFFFNKWVPMLLNKDSSIVLSKEESTRTSEPSEVLLADGRGIVTIDSVFMTRESGKWKNSEVEDEETKDIVYSNVIEPERLKKTLDLYKRLNIIPTTPVTVVEGEEFYDCQLHSSFVSEDSNNTYLSVKNFTNSMSAVSNTKALSESKDFKSIKMNEKKQNKNAFYSSKYLILDQKECDIPKYLETRPPVSPVTENDYIIKKGIKKDLSSLDMIMTDELVRKWLIDNSRNMQQNQQKTISNQSENNRKKPEISNDKHSSSEMLKHHLILETTDNMSKENQTAPPEANSVVPSSYFGSNKHQGKSITKETSNDTGGLDELNNSKLLKTVKTKPQEKEKKTASKSMHDKTEKEQIISTSIPTEIKTGFGVNELNEKNESEIKVEKTQKPQDANKKELNSKVQQMDKNELEHIRTKEDVSSEYPDDSKYKPKPDQEKCDTLPLNGVSLPSKDEILKPTDSEIFNHSTLSEELTTKPTNYNELQDDTKVRDISNKSLTKNSLSEKPQFLETEVLNEEVVGKREENTILSESVLDSKYTPELLVLEDAGSPVGRKHDLSFPCTVNEARSDKRMTTKKDDEELGPNTEPENPINQGITYSDLLEFRSQRDKSETKEPPGVTKKLFDFSEALSSTIGSLISASSVFFTNRKYFSDAKEHSEATTLKFESNEKLETKNSGLTQNEVTYGQILDPTNLELQSKPLDISSGELTFGNDYKKIYYEQQSSRSNSQHQNFTLQSHVRKFDKKTKERTNDNVSNGSIHNSPVSISRDKPVKDTEITKKTEVQADSNYQKKVDDITKNDFIFKKKVQQTEAKPQASNKKSSRNFHEKFVNNMDSHLPLEVKQSENFQEEDFGNHERAVLTVQLVEPEITEVSSDSEFSIERKKDSTSSSESFSVDQYYAKLMKYNERFYSQSNYVYEQQKTKKTQ